MKYALGMDIGGTKIHSALIDEEGRIVDSYRTATEGGREEVLKSIKKSIDHFKGERFEAVGIGTAGFIDSDNGIVTFAGNIKGWTGLNLKEAVEEFTQVPVFVGNDANIAALCEKWIGAAKKLESFIMLTMGTGLGGAIYDENLYFWKGANFQGAELGHMILYPSGRYCTCGQRGCAEKYIAGSSLSLNYEELTGEVLEGPEITKRIETDPKAKEAMKKLAHDMGLYLASIKNIFDPHGVVIGGGFIDISQYWWEDAIKEYEEICNRPEGMKILPAEYLNDAGVIGAGKFAFDNLEEIYA